VAQVQLIRQRPRVCHQRQEADGSVNSEGSFTWWRTAATRRNTRKNTLPAFQSALELGVRFLELDVH